MGFATTVRKFVRAFPGGTGENSVTVTAKRHDGDTTIASASTSGSNDLAGLAEITLTDYEPHYLTATVGGDTLMASSKDVGFVGTLSGWDLDLFGLAWSSGIVKGQGNELAVTAAGTDMKVDIDTGAVIVDGHPARNTASAEVTIGANASGFSRIDLIVVRFVRRGQTKEGDFSFAVVEGTPAADPAPPALTQNSTTWEIPLAEVTVANGASTIGNADITTDRRQFCRPVYPADPGADRILFWDDSAGTWAWLEAGSNLSLSGTSLALATNVDVAGTLDVTGATTLDSTLAVTGAATLSSTLSATGNITSSATVQGADLAATDDLTVGDDATITGDLTVGGAATFLSFASVQEDSVQAFRVLDSGNFSHFRVDTTNARVHLRPTSQLFFSTDLSGPRIQAGSGSPEGVVSARVGSLYLRTDGGSGTTLYVKESGTGTTGWVAK